MVLITAANRSNANNVWNVNSSGNVNNNNTNNGNCCCPDYVSLTELFSDHKGYS